MIWSLLLRKPRRNRNTLLAQPFVKDNAKSVGDYLKSVNADLTVTAFKRVALG
jgi:elongation factor Ts